MVEGSTYFVRSRTGEVGGFTRILLVPLRDAAGSADTGDHDSCKVTCWKARRFCIGDANLLVCCLQDKADSRPKLARVKVVLGRTGSRGTVTQVCRINLYALTTYMMIA